MKGLAFITSLDAEYGFRLAGITHYAVEECAGEGAMKKALSVPKNGLLIVDERIMNSIDEENIRELQQTWPGILLVLPSPEKARGAEEDYALRLIRRAIGYHVKVKT